MLRKPILKTVVRSNSSIDLSAAKRRSNRRMLSGTALLVAALAIPAGLALLQPVTTDSLPANVDHATAILVASLQQSDALLAGFLPDRAFAEPADDFVTTWKTTAANEIIAIPVDRAAGIYSIDWGDGTTSENVTGDQMHSYASAGNHTVRISGNFTTIYLSNDLDNAPKLVSIDRWGAIKWESMARAFYGASDMAYRATDVPDLSEVTDMVSMFRSARNFNGNVSNWDVSNVKEMSYLFSDARSFNQPLNDWDVSNVTGMNSLFEDARRFNQPLNDWNVLQVTDMGWMFNGAHRFNQPLNAWNVSQVTLMTLMFNGAHRFNQPLNDWDVSGVTDMQSMFRDAHNFNQPLNGWDVSGVTDMRYMFRDAHNFNQPLNDWNVSKLTSMFRMFDHALKFNQPLNDWDVSRVTDMSYMFQAAKAFNGNISNWDVSRVTDMGWMFWGADKLDQPLSDWDVSSVTHMNHMFWHADKFNQPLNDWDVSSVTSMDSMFWDAVKFNQPLNDWDVSNVDSMANMFDGATAFDQNLGKWYVLPADTAFDAGDASLNVTTISAQNGFLDDQGPRYGIGAGQNLALFNVTGNTLMFRGPPDPGNYRVNVTASGSVFESGNNWRVLEVTVSSTSNSAPTASAGPDLVLAEGAVFMLNGSATDPNGGGLTYLWTQSPASPVVAFSDTSSPAATITVPQVTADTNVTLTLTATDTSSASATDSLVLAIRETGSAFLTTWNVTETDTTVSIPTEGAYEIIWGDGSAEAVRFSGSQSHSYPAAGTYQVAMTPGLSRIGLSGSGATPERLASIDRWGEIRWTSMRAAFQGASAMTYGAADAPDLSGVTNMVNMLWGATSFNGDISSWDVSNVANMNSMFTSATSFNGNISSWDVSNVANMNSMFASATSFNGNISSWDVSGVTDMAHMFNGATSFNGNISSWDVSDVTDMAHMFYDATSFNGNVSSWDVSGVTDMINMFRDASSFNGNVSSWDVSGVTDMSGMFYRAYSFNGDISSWNVSGVTDMYVMFYRAYSFNGNISSWDVSNVANMNSMFQRASSFNGDISSWDVSGVTDMRAMFQGTSAFDQNLGNWHVVLDDTVISNATETLAIRAQNSWLDNRNPAYGLGTGGDSDLFVITGGTLGRNSTVDYSGKTGYSVNITSTGDFGTGNHRVYDITVTGEDTIPDTAPTVTSIERGVPASQTTDSRTLVFKVTFSEDVTGVDQADFVLSSGDTGTGSVTNLAGSGSQYLVSVSATQDGTYNLDLVSSGHGIADAADNPLADPNPTGADHTYAVDTTAPTVTSIVRSDPAGATTSGRTLVFAVTFSEDVTGVDLSDFALSPDSAGGGSSSGQFTQTSAPAAPITDHNTIQDTITVGPSGTATSVSVAVDITHTYIGDLVVELVAPDGTAQTLHSRSGGSANDIDRTYAPGFDGTGIVGDWTLRIRDHATHDTGTLNSWTLTIDHGGAGSPVTGLAGSGSQYLVTVSAAQDGTYNLDLVPSGHDIADTASNPLTDTVPTTGTDHTYTVSTTPADTTAPTLASIERYSPADQNTDSQTLVYKVTFSEDVTGVDQADFVLSSGGTGTGSVTNLAGSGSQYLVSVSATQDGTYNLDLVSSGHGIADAADNPLSSPAPTGADHTYAVDTTAPTVTSIVRSDPAEATTSGRTLVFAVTFSEDVTGVDQADFVLSSGGTGTGSVTNLAGSGSQYLVSVSATQDGTYNLDLVSSGHGIADAADNPLSSPAPTGADHTYAVDTTAPTVTSIVRSDPAEATTSGRTLVFAVTFSEDVNGVDLSDFALSPDSTGGGSSSGQFTQTSEPALRIADRSTIQDAITVDRSGTATSVSVAVDISHTYRGDLVIVLIAPDGTSQTLHSRTGGSANDIDRTYTPDFDGTGIAGNWTLRVSDRAGGDVGTLNGWTLTIGHGTAGSPVTGLAGSGDAYLVTVSAAQDGTYNLDLVSSGHGITDTPGNPLTDTVPTTGTDHTYTVSTTPADTTAPTLASIERYSPADQNTDSQTLVYKVTFSEDVTGVDQTDFVLSSGGTGTGSVTNLAGSGSQYLVSVSATQDGTYNLDLVSSGHGIADAANNTLSSPVPTGADHTYTVSTASADTTAPTVTSIERSDPAEATTSGRTLVFAVTFSEDVTGVDLSDFALSPGSTGGGSSSGQFTQTSAPAAPITDHNTIQDTITVGPSGTATSVSVAVDITHTYIGDLVVELVAPDGTVQALHSRSGSSANDIDRTYAPGFDGTGIAGDWTLRIRDHATRDTGTLNGWTLTIDHGGADSPVTGLAGSGDAYLVTVSAAQDGTYNLDLVSSGHGITDTPGNPLNDTSPTGEDQSYTVTILNVVPNSMPSVDAGSDQTVQENSVVTLSGTASDADDDPLTYLWSHDSDLTIALSDAASLSTSFTAPQVDSDTTITFTLAAYDETSNATDTTSVTITDSTPPVVADAPRSIGSVTLASTVPGVVEASWDAPAEEPGDYRIAWAKVGEGFRTWTDLTVNAFPTTTSHAITDLEEGAEYKVIVRARYDGGSGDWSGQYTVTVKASVQDTTDPTITLTGANLVSVTTGTAYSDPGATCTDDTDASPTLATTSSVDTLTAGTYQVTYTCTDSSSNMATATRDVVVADAPDTTDPTITLTGANPVSVTTGTAYSDPGATCTDDTDASPTLATTSSVDTLTAGTYQVTYTCTDSSGNTATATRDVVVADAPDTTDPTITLTGANPVSVTTGTAYSDPGATCTDDTDASPTLATTSTVDTLTAGTYQVTYTCTDSSGNTATATRDVVVADAPDTTDPTITLTGANPVSVTTGTAYSDPGATCTDDTDASPTLATTSTVDTLTAGTYQVTYTCTDSSSNMATATRDVVVADAPDTTAPTVSSIERHIPTDQNTGSQTLVYRVTFSENVTGVDVGDFVLSPGSPVAGGASGQFAQTSEPAIPIPDRNTIRDSITVEQSGTATSVSVAVDITHTYIGDLVIDLIAPDGTTRTLHDSTGYETDDIDQTYAPDFGGVGIAGDWTLRVRDGAGGDTGTLNGWTLTINHGSTASPVTEVSGSGDTYQVTVSAAQDGTYNLDLVSSGHGITDSASNPLSSPTPTGADHTYTRTSP